MLIRTLIAACTITVVSELASRTPRIGALILSLPIVTTITFIMTYIQAKNVGIVSRLAQETLILVPIGLIFLVPMALSERLQLDFWPAMFLGIGGTILGLALWMWFGRAGC